jgi:hypothetical protein
MLFNGKVDYKYRIFEVRGTHMDYKPPEVKKTDIHKLTKAAEYHLNISKMNKTGTGFNIKNESGIINAKNREMSAMSKNHKTLGLGNGLNCNI